MLTVDKIVVSYGKIQVLHGISLTIGEKDIVSVVGANGAGKSTLLNTITGLIKPGSGTICFKGENIQGAPPHVIASKGLALVPEGRHIFPRLTVKDNLEMGAYYRRYSATQIREKLETMYELFPRLKERNKQLGGTLSGGEQQMLAIARALMSDPQLLMLDEPSLGLAPVIVDDVFNIIRDVNKKKNIPILLIEQNAFEALEVADRAYVIELGNVVKEGPCKEVLADPAIIEAYLGGSGN